MSEERTAWGWGLASVDAAGTTLDVWYPELNLGESREAPDPAWRRFGTPWIRKRRPRGPLPECLPWSYAVAMNRRQCRIDDSADGNVVDSHNRHPLAGWLR